MASDGIGASVRRKEDHRFITGGGTSPTTSTGPARSMPTSSARRMRTPGSAASTRAGPRRRPACSRCSTGDDVKAAGWGGLICGWMVKSRDGS